MGCECDQCRGGLQHEHATKSAALLRGSPAVWCYKITVATDVTVGADGAFSSRNPVAIGADRSHDQRHSRTWKFLFRDFQEPERSQTAISNISINCVTPTSCPGRLTKVPSSKMARTTSARTAGFYQVTRRPDGGGWTMAMHFKNDGVFGYSGFLLDGQ